MPEVYRQVLLGDASVNEGMLAENAVALQLVASGHALHFYSKASVDAKERMEVVFLIVSPFPDAAMKPRVSPIEVKSGKRYSLVSLSDLLSQCVLHGLLDPIASRPSSGPFAFFS